jgi:hypothetical protein
MSLDSESMLTSPPTTPETVPTWHQAMASQFCEVVTDVREWFIKENYTLFNFNSAHIAFRVICYFKPRQSLLLTELAANDTIVHANIVCTMRQNNRDAAC